MHNEFRQQLRALHAEADELHRLRNQITRKKLELELFSLCSSSAARNKPPRQSIDVYERQIVDWINRLPPEARKAPRTMEEFITLLHGRTPGMKAHPGDVSRVLVRLGFLRQRTWSADGAGRRVWHPPKPVGG